MTDPKCPDGAPEMKKTQDILFVSVVIALLVMSLACFFSPGAEEEEMPTASIIMEDPWRYGQAPIGVMLHGCWIWDADDPTTYYYADFRRSDTGQYWEILPSGQEGVMAMERSEPDCWVFIPGGKE